MIMAVKLARLEETSQILEKQSTSESASVDFLFYIFFKHIRTELKL